MDKQSKSPGPAAERVGELVHGTCIARGGHGVLLRGRSGAGKSDLALRCVTMMFHRTQLFQLVSDDQLLLSREGVRIIVRPPPTIASKLEVRGVGIIDQIHRSQAELRLILDLVDPAHDGHNIERLPQRGACEIVQGVKIAKMSLAAFENSAPIKVHLALQQILSHPIE